MRKTILTFLIFNFLTIFSNDTISLNEVKIISSNRATNNTPISFKNLSKKEINHLNNGQEPSFILNSTPSITNYSDNGSQNGYSYFRLRGIDQTRINMTLDGVPLNESEDQGAYFSNYPDFFNSINSIQIQRGVGTSSNGVSSYAGSINFESPSLNDTVKEFGVNYGSFNSSRIYGVYNSGIIKNQSLYVRISNLYTDGYKYNSANNSKSVFINYSILKTKSIFKFTGFVGNQKNKLAWIGLPMDSINKDSRINGCNKREGDNFTQSLIKMNWIYTIDRNQYINTAIYYNYLTGWYDFDLNNFLVIPSDSMLYRYNFKHNFTGLFTNYTFKNDNITYNTGIHTNYMNRQHKGTDNYNFTYYTTNGIKKEFSYFNKLNYTFNNITFFGDMQFRTVSFNYNGDSKLEPLKWNFLNLRGGINYKLDKGSLYYSYGKTSREPTRNDIFLGNDNLTKDSLGNNILGTITPETVYDTEVGYKFNNDKVKFNINWFWMNFQNEIVLNGLLTPTGLPLHSSVTKSYRTGIELDLEYNITNGLKFITNSSYIKANIVNDNYQITPILTPSVVTNNTLQYNYKNNTIIVSSKYQSYSYIDFNNQYKLPDFTIFNLNYNYQITNYTFGLIVNNITNKKYFTYGNINIYNTPLYFIQAPFNMSIYFKWNF